MPQFELDLGNAHKQFNRLDSFTQGYIEAMFFTFEDRLGSAASFEKLAPETLAAIILDCATFQSQFDALLDWAYSYGDIHENCAYLNDDFFEVDKMAGRDYWYCSHPNDGFFEAEKMADLDYWYSRNGYGVGFWVRELGDCGDLLRAACGYSEKYLYRGDDGLLYLD